MGKSLLIGCGNSRVKKLFSNDQKDWVGELVTVDMNPDCKPTFVLDMSIYCAHMPFEDGEFDEIGAYDVLEHWGRQGDWKAWFDEMSEYHRILKPGGTMGIIVPIGGDALADPGHTRFFGANHFLMLSQSFYDQALQQGLQVTDYRWYWKMDFDVLDIQVHGDHHLSALLRKPA